MLLALTLACAAPDPEALPDAGARPGGDVVLAASADAGPTDSGVPDAAAAHTAAATHGGEVKVVGSLHVEARFFPSGVLLWITDAADRPVDLAGITGTAAVRGPDGATELPLMAMGDHLHVPAALVAEQPASAVVTLSVAKKPVRVAFSTPSVGRARAAHDHASLHGGVVGMWGDIHVEYAPGAGEYRFYVSDVARVTIGDGVSGVVKDDGSQAPLVFDAATGLLHAAGAGAGSRPVTLEVSVRGKSFSLAFPAAG
jgi:hypothetical protein